MPGDPGGMEAAPVETVVGGKADPGGAFHRRDVGREDFRAGRIALFPERQRRGQRHGGAMHNGARMGVVEVEAVDERGIERRRIAQGKPGAHRHHAGPACAAGRAESAEHNTREFLLAGRRRHAECIQNQMPGALPDGGRHILRAQPGRKFPQPLCRVGPWTAAVGHCLQAAWAAVISSPATVVRRTSRTSFTSSKGRARCMVRRLSQITRSLTRHSCA